ncbi:MAG: hypothetical protein LBI69_01745 [Puniceicoccales bacterium]|jgi:hypothetical protein|nr:hypothetical protein [Puniceicoccales bacterium]
MLLDCDNENKIRCLKQVKMNNRNSLPLACIDCLEEGTKTINLLHYLQMNLDICNAFGNLEETDEIKSDDDPESLGKSNHYMIHFLEQMMQHFSRKNGENNFSFALKATRPIEENAKNNYNELVDAANALEKAGMKKFYTDVPPHQVRISSLAMVMHHKFFALRNVIAQCKNNQDIYEMLSKILEDQMKKINELEKSTIHIQDSDSNIKYYIAIMENECILNILELNSVEEFGEINLQNW